MGILWYKVWRDLWGNKLRTFLVVLSTAVGVFALGLIFGLFQEMRARMAESYRATMPAHIRFYTSRFDQEVVDATLREPGVVDAEGQMQVSFRWKLEGEADWRSGTLFARPDYQAQHMNRISLIDGHWPTERTLAVERLSSQHFDLLPGTTISIDTALIGAEQHEQRLPVESVVRDLKALPPQLGFGGATFYATPGTVTWLSGRRKGFNQLGVRLKSLPEEVPFQEGAGEAAQRIERRLQGMGLVVSRYTIEDPKVHWAQKQLDTVFTISTVLGVLSLGLSGLLIVNTMNAILTQQVWQIGVIKAIGGTTGLVASLYLAMSLVYGLLSLLLAVPLGAVAAHLTARWLLDLVNVTVDNFQVMPAALGVQIAVGLSVPLLAALVPVIGSARITPHQAIANYGLGRGFGRSWLDRLIGRIRRLPPLLALSLRNVFRRKIRVVLTLLTLVLSGVTFIMVMSVDRSLNSTIELLLQESSYDVQIRCDYLYLIAELIEVAQSVPGVARAEVWEYRAAQLSLAGGQDRLIVLWGVPDSSEMFSPRITSGRGLLPGDGYVVLLSSDIAAEEGLRVGDEIELAIGERTSMWTVKGTIASLINSNYVPFDALARETDAGDYGAIVMVRAQQRDPETRERLIHDLRDAYTANEIRTSRYHSADEVRRVNRSLFSIVTNLMLVMVALAATVGSIGLMSTMSINVVERGREIGVLRAIGAPSPAIAGIFVVEGTLVGVLSWLIAVPLSYPSAWAFSRAIGYTLIQAPLHFRYSIAGMLLWLLIVAALSALASALPALSATRVSVRESLAYE